MANRVDIYTVDGMASGILVGAGHVRDRIADGAPLALEHVTWQDLSDLVPREVGGRTFDADDLVLVAADEEFAPPVHVSWHAVRLDIGPYVVEGDLPTMPGFDPGRALTRPSGEFLVLQDVRLTLRDRPDLGIVTSPRMLVNRYTVDRVAADLMLGYFFPGAEMESRSVGATAEAY